MSGEQHKSKRVLLLNFVSIPLQSQEKSDDSKALLCVIFNEVLEKKARRFLDTVKLHLVPSDSKSYFLFYFSTDKYSTQSSRSLLDVELDSVCLEAVDLAARAEPFTCSTRVAVLFKGTSPLESDFCDRANTKVEQGSFSEVFGCLNIKTVELSSWAIFISKLITSRWSEDQQDAQSVQAASGKGSA
ncbi:hypothetical protein BDV93DRAFT_548694 [Ceratobasidium sp. AG-I]|nr:hypothetical protein BDV93DRAFT_548694 [Ceratobasidium sp. AG-I]